MSRSIAFDDWSGSGKIASRRHTLAAFNTLSDHVLTLSWEPGFDPTIAAITQTATDSQPGTLNRRP
jgi:hypothetical protein